MYAMWCLQKQRCTWAEISLHTCVNNRWCELCFLIPPKWNEVRAAISIYGNNNLSASKSTSINTISFDWSIDWFRIFFHAHAPIHHVMIASVWGWASTYCARISKKPIHWLLSFCSLWFSLLIFTWLTKSSASSSSSSSQWVLFFFGPNDHSQNDAHYTHGARVLHICLALSIIISLKYYNYFGMIKREYVRSLLWSAIVCCWR